MGKQKSDGLLAVVKRVEIHGGRSKSGLHSISNLDDKVTRSKDGAGSVFPRPSVSPVAINSSAFWL